MCNAYKLKTDLAEIARAAQSQLGQTLKLPPGVTPQTSNLAVPDSVFPRRDGLILRPADPATPASGLEPLVAYWNLTPYFHKGALKDWKASCNNCRSETMAASPAFRGALARRRAIIPATAFTEWTGPKGSKTAHAISRRDGGLLFLAGLWDSCDTPDGPAESYTMVMQPAVAGDDMAPFHHRQPVVLDAAGAATWLDLAADWRQVVRSPPPGALVADPPQPAIG